MSHFYGTVAGSAETAATRRGTKASGLVTHTASWSGAVRSRIFVRDNEDWVEVSMVTWRGRGSSHLIYRGPVGEFKPDGTEYTAHDARRKQTLLIEAAHDLLAAAKAIVGDPTEPRPYLTNMLRKAIDKVEGKS